MQGHLIQFTLPYTLPTLNTVLRAHWTKRRKSRNALAWAVVSAIGRQRPLSPFSKARVRIERHSVGTPDEDGVQVKALLDVLQPFSPRHPAGLGVITNDSPAFLVLEISSVKVPSKEDQKTVVYIEDLSDIAAAVPVTVQELAPPPAS